MKSVYVMQNKTTGQIKIGVSNNVEERKMSIQGASGCEIDVVYSSDPIKSAYAVEYFVHNSLSEYRTIGEWFNVDKSVAVEELKSAINNGVTNKEQKKEKKRKDKRAVDGYNHVGLLTTEERAEKYLNGETVSSIARQAGVSRTAVISSLKRAGVHDPTNKGGRPMGKMKNDEDEYYDIENDIKPPFNILEMDNPPRKDGTITANLYKDGDKYVVFDWKGSGATYYNTLKEIKEFYEIYL